MLDLHKLRVFFVVAQEGSFSAAAERLYITQSAVSQQIKELEASLGQALFEREWRGVRLTPSGEILTEYTRQIFDLIAQAENALTNVQQLASGKVSLGATPGIGVYLAPLWVQGFRARFPHLTVALNTGVTAQVVGDVLNHRVDLGIIEGELDDLTPPRLDHLIMSQVEQQIVVGSKHPFWHTQQIAPADLRAQSFITRQQNSQSRIWLERTLKRLNIEPLIGAEFDNLESIKRAVAAGTCVAVLPAYVVQNEIDARTLHAVPVAGRPFVREIKLVWDRDVRFSPIVRAFITFLTTDYPSLGTALKPQ